jgi:hypothetical protein
MLQLQELAALYMLAKDYYRGEGEIVDLGPLLGVGTNALARGLAENRAVSNRDKRIHSFDLFLAKGMGTVIAEPSRSGSVFDRFLRNNHDYLRHISISPGDLMEMSWDRSPVEILFIDLAKTWELNAQVLRQFFKYLIPGRSIVVQQDFVHCFEYWIPITMEHFAEYFEHLYFVPGSSSVYRFVKEIPDRLIYESIRDMPVERKSFYLRRARERSPADVREILKCSEVCCLADHGSFDAAADLLKTVDVSMTPDPGLDFIESIVPNFRATYKHLVKTSGRSVELPPAARGAIAADSGDGLVADLSVVMARTKQGSHEPMRAHVSVRNISPVAWSLESAQVGQVNLGAHLLGVDHEVIEFDFLRRALGAGDRSVIAPGEQVAFEIEIPLPPYGRHVLEFDLVAEMVCWFAQNGSKTVRIPVEVG